MVARKKLETKALVPEKKAKGFFKPGNKYSVGNSGGVRAKRNGRYITAALEAELQRDMEDPDRPGTAKRTVDLMIRNMCRIAVKGADADAVRAFKEIADRAEGKAKQDIEVSGKDGKPIEIIGRQMTPLEASRAFQRMLNDDDEDD